MNRLKKILRIILKYFFPPQCVFCDRILEINVMCEVCDDCKSLVSRCRDKLCCQKCGKPIVSHGKRVLCYFCLETKTKYFDRIASVFEYSGPVRESIHRYKLAGLQSYAEAYAEFLGERLLEEYKDIEFDIMCAAPSHENKVRTQGFDNVDLICRRLSRITGIPHQKALINKVRKTSRQAELDFQKRIRNLSNSMEVKRLDAVKDKTVLLIDDICTTRATVIEASRALKKAGAKRVYALTLATTPKEKG